MAAAGLGELSDSAINTYASHVRRRLKKVGDHLRAHGISEVVLPNPNDGTDLPAFSRLQTLVVKGTSISSQVVRVTAGGRFKSYNPPWLREYPVPDRVIPVPEMLRIWHDEPHRISASDGDPFGFITEKGRARYTPQTLVDLLDTIAMVEPRNGEISHVMIKERYFSRFPDLR